MSEMPTATYYIFDVYSFDFPVHKPLRMFDGIGRPDRSFACILSYQYIACNAELRPSLNGDPPNRPRNSYEVRIETGESTGRPSSSCER